MKALAIVAVPPGVVTDTSTSPAPWAGVSAVAWVAETTVTPVASTPPNRTCIPARNRVPVSVTDVPPPVGPVVGLTEASVGASTYVKPLVSVAEPPTVATETSTVPAACEGSSAVSSVPDRLGKTASEGLFPKVTRVSPVKPVPVSVTFTPPDEGPAEGATAVSVVPPTNR